MKMAIRMRNSGVTVLAFVAGSAVLLAVGCGSAEDDSTGVMADAAAAGDIVNIKMTHSGKCAEVKGSSSTNGTPIQQNSCNNTSAQKFKLVKKGAYFQIRPQNSNKCMIVAGGSTAQGAKLQQAACSTADTRMWTLINRGGDNYSLQAKHSGLCVDVPGSSQNNEIQLTQWTCHGGANQVFTLSTGSGGGTGGSGGSGGGSTGGTGGGSTGGTGGGSTGGTGGSGGGQVTQPVCVWNQAYQENFSEDSVADIVAQANNCYVLIDPFGSTAARNAIASMKQKGNVVGCYISVGTCEDWRPDFAQMKPYCVDQQWDQWGGEYFVDLPTPELIALMNARTDKMAEWGCDMVEFDNMDWAFDSANRREYGFRATAADAIAYNQAICDYIHTKGMGCMAKNTRRGATSFDGGTFESYNNDKDWWTHADLQGFLDDGKYGIIVHYNETACDTVYSQYKSSYNDKLSFICEDRSLRKYRHYN